jgi:hypothetical protein
MSSELTQSIFDVAGLNSQFVAILLGAFLASAGGFFVTWLLDHLERKRQERSIALVCLDLLASLGVMTNLAQRARGFGDPYGPFTMRLVRGCLRDLDVYERNRERIADIADPNIRAEIYQCMTRLTLSLDGILSEHDLIEKLDETISELRPTANDAKIADLTKQRDERAWRRNSSFDFMLETVKDLGTPLAEKLRVIAKSAPQPLQDVVARQTAASGVSTPPPAPEQPAKPQATAADA